MSVTGNYSPRETAMVALFELVSTAYKYKTASRKLKLWAETQQEDRPCLFMHEIDDDVTGDGKGVPQITVMHVNLFIYTWAHNVAVPASILNPLIDSVFQVLSPSVLTGKCNLGLGFIDNCWVSGKIIKDTGDLDGDGLAIIPVSIRMGAPLPYPS